MSWIRHNKTILFIWLFFAGGYAIASLLLPYGRPLTAFGDVAQCLVLLFTNAGLLLNAGSPDWRRNTFWMLLALGCGLWLAGQLMWTYVELVQRRQVPNPFIGDVIFFLHTVPLLGALGLRPYAPRTERSHHTGYVDLLLLLCWWVYLYLFIVIPWQYIAPDMDVYNRGVDHLYGAENLILIAGFLYFALRTHGPWRRIYFHLFGASACYLLASTMISDAIEAGTYHTGSLYDIGLISSFVWYGVAGIVARRVCPPAEACQEKIPIENTTRENLWPTRLTMAAALSLPILAMWCEFGAGSAEAVHRFRLMVTLVTMVVFTSLVFLRQRLVDEDRLLLLRDSQESIQNLKRIQNQFVQSEKLASLGKLAAGAAHEINNPLTVILGFSDVLLSDPTMPANAKSIAQKIREQARRTKGLVGKLLSFAQPLPAERTLLDINSILSSALELRRLDLMDRSIRIELETRANLPGVRGDANQLLQVFFNIISNAVDAMEEIGGGVLTVRTSRDPMNVIIEFADTGPGIKDPSLVFDPFYTTKPTGKGTGLGLSICYGVIVEHKGQITCFNRPQGGATFRIELPAVLALFPAREANETPAGISLRLS
jgi:signal transduction histidine kinase